MPSRPGKVRKEIYFTTAEMIRIRAIARYYGLNVTAAIKMLTVLGMQSLPRNTDNVVDKL